MTIKRHARRRKPGVNLVEGKLGDAITQFDVESVVVHSKKHGYHPAVRIIIQTLEGGEHIFLLSSQSRLKDATDAITSDIIEASARAYLDVDALEAELEELASSDDTNRQEKEPPP